MRALALVVWSLACALAACGDEAQVGTVIAVSAPDGMQVDFVKLYTGLPRQGMETPVAITPEGFAAADVTPHAGILLQRDRIDNLDILELAPGGVARFGFKPGGTSERLAAVVAVGYAVDGAGGRSLVAAAAAYGVAISTDQLTVHELVLGPVADPTLSDARTQRAARVWGPPTSENRDACLYYDDPAFMPEVGQTLILVEELANDPDCDGFVEGAGECTPLAYLGETRVSEGTLCLLQEPVPGDVTQQTCRLGTLERLCRDGEPPSAEACAPEPFCVENTVCAACSTQPDPVACVRGGAVTNLMNLDPPASIVARVGFTEGQGSVVVPLQFLSIDLTANGVLGGRECTDVKFLPANGDITNAFNTLDLGLTGMSTKIVEPPCTVELKVDPATSSTAPAGRTAMLQLRIENNGIAENDLLVPLEVAWTSVTAETGVTMRDLSNTIGERSDVAVCLPLPTP